MGGAYVGETEAYDLKLDGLAIQFNGSDFLKVKD
jgi:hypothetical protein